MKPTADPEIEKLLAAARESRLVIFAGAGVSVGAPTNLPSWSDVNRLVVRSLASAAAPAVSEPLATKAAELILARHEQEKLPPEYQAQVLAEFLHGRYFEVLRHLDSDRPNPTHLAIAWLARLGCVRAIITTNFDRVIEAAFAAVGAPLEPCFQPVHFVALANNLARLDNANGTCHLLKLHGSVDDPATLIDTLAQRKQGLAMPVMDCVRHLLHSFHWLFLGFSGLDLQAERNYLALEPEAERAAGFTWFVRAKTQPKPAVVRLVKLYGARGRLVEGNLPEWLVDFASFLSPKPRIWIDNYMRNSPPGDAQANTLALEEGATKWAADLTPNISALALIFIVIASAEPQTAAQLAERVLQAIQERTKRGGKPGTGRLLLEAVAANSFGILLGGLGRHEEAVQWLSKAIALAGDARDDDSRDRFRGNLACSLETLGRIDEAGAAYQSALAGYRERGDPVPLAFGLIAISSHQIRQLRLDEARGLAEEAIEWATKAGDERQRGMALNNLGIIAKLKDDNQAALKYFAEVEELFTRLGNDDAVAAALGNRGEVLAQLGRFDEAERIQHAVMKINERLERRDNLGANCLSLGTLFTLRGDLPTAEIWFMRAREIFKAIKDPSNEALAVLRLATTRASDGRFEDAIALAKSALPLATERNTALTSDLWNQIGQGNFKLGYVNRAEEAYRKVLALTDSIEVAPARAGAATNLGTILLISQRDEEAAKFFTDAAAWWTRVDDRQNLEYCKLGEATARLDQKLAALSDAGHAERDPEKQRAAARQMITLYPELIAMYEKIGIKQLAAMCCVSAASSASFVGDVNKAIPWYRRAAEIFQGLGMMPNAQQALEKCKDLLRRVTNALMAKRMMAEALPGLLQLAEVAGQLGYRQDCAISLYNAAIALLASSQDYSGAKNLAQQALEYFPTDSNDAATTRRFIAYCDQQGKPT